MNGRGYRAGNNVRWIAYLLLGLAVESVCLVVVLFAWMASRGLPLSAIAKIVASTPVLASRTPTPGIAFTQTPAPSYPAQTPVVNTVEPSPRAPTSTDAPEGPDFLIPPPGKIVFTCFDGQYDQICLMNGDGSGRRQLTSESATNFYPSLSIDGEAIVFASKRDGNFEIYIMDTQGRNVMRLTDNIGNLYAPEISPKGNRIVFTAEAGGTQSLWLMKLNGSNARPLVQTGGGDIDPTWSPDGDRIAFVSGLGFGTGVFIADVDSERYFPVMREHMQVSGRVSWSLDGDWLAFSAGPKGDRDLYLVSPNGGGLEQLTFGGDNLSPSFSPDGEWLAFTSYRDGINAIYVINLSDMQTYRLTYEAHADWQPRWGP